jgi:hypothetical protein
VATFFRQHYPSPLFAASGKAHMGWGLQRIGASKQPKMHRAIRAQVEHQ